MVIIHLFLINCALTFFTVVPKQHKHHTDDLAIFAFAIIISCRDGKGPMNNLDWILVLILKFP